MTQTMGQREDLFRITGTISGTDLNGNPKTAKYSFDSFDGGDVTAKETKYRPGNGTKDQKSLGGASEVTNITVTKLNNPTVNGDLPWLLSQVGVADFKVSKQPLDLNGAAFGKPLAYKGRLQAVNPPKTNSESDTPAIISFTQSSVTPVTSG